MGKRKSRRALAPKRKTAKLDIEFVCPICNYGKNVKCVINLDSKVGTAECFVCKSSYTMEANGSACTNTKNGQSRDGAKHSTQEIQKVDALLKLAPHGSSVA